MIHWDPHTSTSVHKQLFIVTCKAARLMMMRVMMMMMMMMCYRFLSEFVDLGKVSVLKTVPRVLKIIPLIPGQCVCVCVLSV